MSAPAPVTEEERLPALPVILLALSFLVVFLAVIPFLSFTSLAYGERVGTAGLAIDYGVFCLVCFVAPSVVKRLTASVSIMIAPMLYVLCALCAASAVPGLLYLGCAIAGVGTGIIWTACGIAIKCITAPSTRGRFTGLFFFIFRLSFLGNLLNGLLIKFVDVSLFKIYYLQAAIGTLGVLAICVVSWHFVRPAEARMRERDRLKPSLTTDLIPRLTLLDSRTVDSSSEDVVFAPIPTPSISAPVSPSSSSQSAESTIDTDTSLDADKRTREVVVEMGHPASGTAERRGSEDTRRALPSSSAAEAGGDDDRDRDTTLDDSGGRDVNDDEGGTTPALAPKRSKITPATIIETCKGGALFLVARVRAIYTTSMSPMMWPFLPGVFSVSGFAKGYAYSILPTYAGSEDAGFVMVALGISVTCSNLVCGVAYDRIRQRRNKLALLYLMFAFAASGFGTAMIANATGSYFLLYIAAILIGFVMGAMDTITNTYIANFAPASIAETGFASRLVFDSFGSTVFMIFAPLFHAYDAIQCAVLGIALFLSLIPLVKGRAALPIED